MVSLVQMVRIVPDAAVRGRHISLTHFYPWMAETFGLGEIDRFTMLSGIAHDPIQRDGMRVRCHMMLQRSPLRAFFHSTPLLCYVVFHAFRRHRTRIRVSANAFSLTYIDVTFGFTVVGCQASSCNSCESSGKHSNSRRNTRNHILTRPFFC